MGRLNEPDIIAIENKKKEKFLHNSPSETHKHGFEMEFTAP